MNKELKENNYLLIDNFISKDEANNLHNKLKTTLKENPDQFAKDSQCPLSDAIYNFRPFLNLLCQKISHVNYIMEESMLPCYTYARIYRNDDELKKHIDRPSCEVSLTVHLGGDAPWDIWMTKQNGEQVAIDLKPGQAVLYLGVVSEHWREKYKGQEYSQVFLHYVRGNGENWLHFGDKH